MDTDSYNKSLLFGGFPGASVGKESTCQCRRREFRPWGGDPSEEEMATHSSVFA